MCPCYEMIYEYILKKNKPKVNDGGFKSVLICVKISLNHDL
jgi:hypothetical protein